MTDDERIRQAENELYALRKAARAGRKQFKNTHGKLASAFAAAMQIVDARRADGVPFEERIQGLEQTLREAWPQTREWKYLCEACRDTGLVMAVCRAGARCNGVSTRIDAPGQRPGKYRRLCTTDPESSYEHDYGTPCVCSKGARFRDKPEAAPEDFAAAGKSRKLTRVGR